MSKTIRAPSAALTPRRYSIAELKRRRQYTPAHAWRTFDYPPYRLRVDSSSSWLTEEFGSTYVTAYQMVGSFDGVYDQASPAIPLLATSLYCEEETYVQMSTALMLLVVILSQSDIIAASWSEIAPLSHSMMIVRADKDTDDEVTWALHHEILTSALMYSPEDTWHRNVWWKPWCRTCYTRHWASEPHNQADDEPEYELYAAQTFVFRGEEDNLTLLNVSAYA